MIVIITYLMRNIYRKWINFQSDQNRLRRTQSHQVIIKASHPTLRSRAAALLPITETTIVATATIITIIKIAITTTTITIQVSTIMSVYITIQEAKSIKQ